MAISDSARSLKLPARRFSSRSVTSAQFIAFTTSRQCASRSLTVVVVRVGRVVVGAGAVWVDVVAPGALSDVSPSPHPVSTTAAASATSIQFRGMQPRPLVWLRIARPSSVRWVARALVRPPPTWSMMPLNSGTHHSHSKVSTDRGNSKRHCYIEPECVGEPSNVEALLDRRAPRKGRTTRPCP
jgi:hypothetical protein